MPRIVFKVQSHQLSKMKVANKRKSRESSKVQICQVANCPDTFIDTGDISSLNAISNYLLIDKCKR